MTTYSQIHTLTIRDGGDYLNDPAHWRCAYCHSLNQQSETKCASCGARGKAMAKTKAARYTAIAIDCMERISRKYAVSANLVASGVGSESMKGEAKKYIEIMEAIKYFEAHRDGPVQGSFLENENG